MKQFGLVGYPLSHSYSKDLFTKKFNDLGLTDYSYNLFPLMSINRVVPLIEQNPDLKGFNVTTPHKQTIIPFLNEVAPVAKKIFAVNTVNITSKNGTIWLVGHNTDFLGFKESIKPLLKEGHKRAIILGTGGSSKAVAYAFEEMGIEYLFVSRSTNIAKTINYSEINKSLLSMFNIIVNTTPVGMEPKVNEKPEIPYELLGPEHLVYDLIYNPEESEFLKTAKLQGCQIKNGLEMLEKQAEEAWKIWQNTNELDEN